ncbi:ABC transporter permease [Cytobacillus kochii]|uniref:ABC transporter permease n=1 Tax=Cytobacillus kochii TaxID=859143 RepID=UPI00203D1F2D|nr:ABC transporter permease [Cytobacillus kochii]MCM3322601.1 ABC transporter permease [Cytobacillus kochii]MCM3344920.1 ABC transporter permease [Cytobacillus kochii]
MNVQQIKVLMIRELKDLRFNGQVLLLFFTAFAMIFFIYVLNNLTITFSNEQITFFKGMTSLLSFISILVTMYTQGNLMVEEKEQGTGILYRLMKIRRINIFLAKSIVTYSMSYLLFTIGMIIYGYSLAQILMASIFTIPFFCMWLLIGTAIAEYAKNTIDVSLYGWPIMIVYFLIEGLVYSSLLNKLTILFPNYHIERGLTLIENDDFTSGLKFMIVPFIWGGIALLFLIKRRQKKVSIEA